MRSPTNASTSEECPEANDISLPIRPKAADVTLPLASRKCRATRGRSRTLGAPGDFANLHQLLTRETEVEGLHRALAESREEALLAARIGQTLLERNQEMDAEIERKDIAVSALWMILAVLLRMLTLHPLDAVVACMCSCQVAPSMRNTKRKRSRAGSKAHTIRFACLRLRASRQSTKPSDSLTNSNTTGAAHDVLNQKC